VAVGDSKIGVGSFLPSSASTVAPHAAKIVASKTSGTINFIFITYLQVLCPSDQANLKDITL
jgi:hypothetical protein